MKVTTKSYPRQYRLLWNEIQNAIHEAVFDDAPILGTSVERFEAELAAFHGVSYAVGVGSGSDAISMLLENLGLNCGEIITSSWGEVAHVLASGGESPPSGL